MPWCNEKCWGVGTKLLMFDGRVKTIEDIVRDHRAGIANVLMGDDNTPRTVLGASQGNTARDEQRWMEMATGVSPRPAMYRIVSHDLDRDSFTCNGDHILVVKFNSTPSAVQESGDHDRHCARSFTFNMLMVVNGEKISTSSQPNTWRGGVVFMNTPTYATQAEAEAARAEAAAAWAPLVWECSVDQFLQCTDFIRTLAQMYQPDFVQFAPPTSTLCDHLESVLGHPVAREQVLSTAWVLGLCLTESSHARIFQTSLDKNCRTHTAVILALDRWYAAIENVPVMSGLSAADGLPVLQKLIDAYRLHDDSHFPLDLLRESKEVRMALLAGVIDGDGDYLEPSRVYSVRAKERRFIDGVIHLSRGLGFTTGAVSVTHATEADGTAYSCFSISISGVDLPTIPTELASKRDTTSDELRRDIHCDHRCQGFDVHQIAHAAYFGLALDHNERCLLGDFVVTHNSKYAIYQHVMVERRLPPIPDDVQLHPKLVECIHACHEFEPQARPGQRPCNATHRRDICTP
jgi:hypothetical protein